MEKVIEVKGLTKKFKDLVAVNNLELNVYRGDVFGFLGPNGAGKSTTIRMLLSLIKPTAGSINILGIPLRRNRKKILRRVGAIVEKPDFYLYLSAYKNLEILGKTSGIEVDNKRIMGMLELVKLADRAKSKVKTFSHGMKQRLGIAQALLHNPELIILDEPTTGLDPEGMKEVRDLIVHLAKDQGKTIFLSSHLLSEIELIATRMIIINKGKTQVEGRVSELLSSDKLQVKFEFDDIEKAIKVLHGSRWTEFLQTQNTGNLIFEINKEEISLLNSYFVENNIGVSAVIPTRSLEEFFLKITREV
ncbi:MAG: bacitracin ABC transporter ATP-binding protein [Ignavibacteria bacterium RBG_13_36_8]|nr:MAG: bacitracin ABC transporter ATP-binding protein [Ignavibacteria bacterium RBG_13_36_8]